MCGIVGYVGERRAADVLLPALERLEYRGYDSAGIATLNGHGIDLERRVGKLSNLAGIVREAPPPGTVGIGHTRWATHGKPTETNAHPHAAGDVAVIHNGIVENHLELRAELEAAGRELRSETDSEVIAHLIDLELAARGSLVEATRAAVRRLTGSFAVVVLSPKAPGRLVAAKTATPIVVGVTETEAFVASDVPAILDHTRDVVFLEDGDVAEIGPGSLVVTTVDGEPVDRAPQRITWDPITAQKDGFKHFLEKEIHEQPEAIADTLRGRIRLASGAVDLPELTPLDEVLAEARRIVLVGCGTARHSGLVAEHYFATLGGVDTTVDYASELRYRDHRLGKGDVVIAVSQSGETADTLGAVEEARRAGATTIGVVNVLGSSIARAADAVVYTHAGPEISVCSTKAFTTQVVALFLMALRVGRLRRHLGVDATRELLAELRNLPPLVREAIGESDALRDVARRFAAAENFLYLGRGLDVPIALEGALKLKEISYVHAEGYPAGEMKHGPIALVTEDVPVVVLLPRDALFAKTLGNLREVASRGARIVAVTDSPTEELERVAEAVVVVPTLHPLLAPVLRTIPLQLLAYHVAVLRGTDVDQPRNLAKSVTVE